MKPADTSRSKHTSAPEIATSGDPGGNRCGNSSTELPTAAAAACDPPPGSSSMHSCRAARDGSNQPDVLQGIMTVDIDMSHVGAQDLPGLVGQGSGTGLPSPLPLTQRADGA